MKSLRTVEEKQIYLNKPKYFGWYSCSVFRTLILPSATCSASGTGTGKGSSNQHRVGQLDGCPLDPASLLEAERCSLWGLWGQASVEQVDPEPTWELQGEQRRKGSSECTSLSLGAVCVISFYLKPNSPC